MSKVKSVDQLAEGYALLVSMDGLSKWKWARDLNWLLDSITDKKSKTATSETLGIDIAKRLGRDKPYSGAWVRQHAAAYRKFPAEPATIEAKREFLDAVNGNTSRTEKKDAATDAPPAEPGTPHVEFDANTPDPLEKLRKLIRHLLNDGFAITDIMAAVQDGLGKAK